MLNTDKTQATTQKQITVSNWHDYNLYPVFYQVELNSFFRADANTDVREQNILILIYLLIAKFD